MNKKIAIIGATSGIGRALARKMHQRGHTVGATGRRIERLEELKQELRHRIHTQYMDVTELGDSIDQLEMLMQQMGGLDIIVLNAGVSYFRDEASGRESDLHVIDVNIRGFANLAAYSFARFKEQGHGQIVGLSSIASLFGWGLNVPYNASKAFVNTYLQGYRQKANHSDADISVTTLLPGFVESEMTEGKKNLFWVATAERAARQMADAIESQRNEAYITRRWRLAAWAAKLTPNWIWNRL